MAHITGGGDWDWSLKAIQDYPNVYTDMSGSVIDARVIEKTVAMLGANRVLFGTDLLEMAAARHIPVRLPARLVDNRGRHWLDTPENLSYDDMAAIVRLCPDTDFILCSTYTFALAGMLAGHAAERKGRLYYDFSRLEECYSCYGVSMLLKNAGEDRLRQPQ